MPDTHKQMIKAVKSGDVEKVKNLLASDASLIQARDIDGSTPLHCGCESTKPSQKPGSPFLVSEGRPVYRTRTSGDSFGFVATVRLIPSRARTGRG